MRKPKIIQEAHYNAFGLPLAGLTTLGRPTYSYFFTGKELSDDESLVWYDYGARIYDVQIGRWTSHDPVYQMATPYGYCANNAIDNYDPDGRKYRPNGSWISYDIEERNNEDPNDPLDDSTWGGNLFGTVYSGGNNPMTKGIRDANGNLVQAPKYYYGRFDELAYIEFVGIEHDQAYDDKGINEGGLALFSDPRIYIEDKTYVNKMNIAAIQCFWEGDYKNGARGLALSVGLHTISEVKTPIVVNYYSVTFALESTDMITQTRVDMHVVGMSFYNDMPGFIQTPLKPAMWTFKADTWGHKKVNQASNWASSFIEGSLFEFYK